MELKYEKTPTIPEGLHKGQIIKVEERKTPEGYVYVDVFIRSNFGGEQTRDVKWGAPANLSTNSKLAKTLRNFLELEDKEVYDPKTILQEQQVTFQTMNKTKKTGEFAEVVDGSIKPIKEEEAVA